jgi:hypothetical protein
LLKDDSVRPIVRGSVYLEEGLSNAQVLTGQEAVQLHQQLKVDIVTLRCLAVRAANVMSVEIDTCSENLIVSFEFRLATIWCAGSRSLRRIPSNISTKKHLRRDTRPPLAYEGEDRTYPLLRCRRCG